MKKLLKVIGGIVLGIAIIYAGVHFYFEGAENAVEANMGKAPTQAQASVNADAVDNDLARLLTAKDGALFSAQISRTIEDARDSLKAGKEESGLQYLQNAKDFIAAHMNEIQQLDGIDMGLVEWFMGTEPKSLLEELQ
jgi:hypothetical protein